MDQDGIKIVVAWKNSSGAGRARVGTVSGSPSAPAISFGTEAGFTSNNIAIDFAIAMEYDFANGEGSAGPTFIHHDTTQGKLVATPAMITGTTLNFYTPAVGPTVDANKIVAIGELEESSKEVIDAKWKIVAPGFVDIHTHYDGQVTWDPYLRPSTYHGVTTVVMGNCGVGFSPCKPEERDWLISLMEGVEDIPGTALHEGINWQWESFPEYLDTLEGKPLAIDVGTQIPHGAVRAYVMGQRGIDREEASQEEIEQMSQIVKIPNRLWNLSA